MVSFAWATPPYQVVVTDFPYITETNTQGQSIGLGVELLEKISAVTGFDYQITHVPFKRALRMMEHGQADIFVGPYYSDERATYMNYNQYPIYSDYLYFYTRADQPLEDDMQNWQRNYANLATLDIAVIAGWSYGEQFDHHRSELSVIEVESVESALKMLSSGRVDLVAAHDRSVNDAKQQDSDTVPVQKLIPAIYVNHGYFGFSVETVPINFMNAFDKAFQSLRDSGQFDSLLKKYEMSAPVIEAIEID
ncbi:ABC transporter, periplasmic substrate-binding protein, putative [Reinekea sp. MED297]|uniref:ABC transporter, periplasmic substrate-binding protein, putative n=2 Tax=Reinekea TaxID=230494 RepID=A4BGZ6_9GAMM|nr:ABC transporter, periplasmic substrate-binding protein, putative [Reinekea sp. MED297] [Reinekea blandensis MED297]